MFVRYYMTESPTTVSPQTTVGEAEEILVSSGFRHLPVVDQEYRLVGMVTDRDIRSAYPSSIADDEMLRFRAEKVEQEPVQRIMSQKTVVLRNSSTLDDAMLFFENRTVGALPVLDERERVIGILSFADLMKAWKGLFGLGEKGSLLLALEPEAPDQPLTELVRALEENSIPFSRIIRTDGKGKEPAMIYLKVRTYNVRAVHRAIEQAGFTVHAPESMTELWEDEGGDDA